MGMCGVRGYFSSFLSQRDEVGGVSTNRTGGQVAGEKAKSTNRVNGEGSHYLGRLETFELS
jgi:hypothetical protein